MTCKILGLSVDLVLLSAKWAHKHLPYMVAVRVKWGNLAEYLAQNTLKNVSCWYYQHHHCHPKDCYLLHSHQLWLAHSHQKALPHDWSLMPVFSSSWSAFSLAQNSGWFRVSKAHGEPSRKALLPRPGCSAGRGRRKWNLEAGTHPSCPCTPGSLQCTGRCGRRAVRRSWALSGVVGGPGQAAPSRARTLALGLYPREKPARAHP